MAQTKAVARRKLYTDLYTLRHLILIGYLPTFTRMGQWLGCSTHTAGVRFTKYATQGLVAFRPIKPTPLARRYQYTAGPRCYIVLTPEGEALLRKADEPQQTATQESDPGAHEDAPSLLFPKQDPLQVQARGGLGSKGGV